MGWQCPEEHCEPCAQCDEIVDVRCHHPFPQAFYHRVHDCMMPALERIDDAALRTHHLGDEARVCLVGDYSSFGAIVASVYSHEFRSGKLRWTDQYQMKGGQCDKLGPDPMACGGTFVPGLGRFSSLSNRTHPNKARRRPTTRPSHPAP